MHESIRKQMIEIGQLCYQRNLLVAMMGTYQPVYRVAIFVYEGWLSQGVFDR